MLYFRKLRLEKAGKVKDIRLATGVLEACVFCAEGLYLRGIALLAK